MQILSSRACLRLAIAGAATLYGTAYAQEEGSIEEQVVPGQTESPEAYEQAPIEQIVVTGSRIRRDEFTSSAPIQIITTDKSALAGLINSAEILQNSAVATGQQIDDSFSGFVTDGGPGAFEISLRGLGGQRSLVLVNGKRWAPSGVRGATNSVDLSAIPNRLINRYEILKDGASSIYGADAVAGVVNAITRTAIDGASIDVTYRQPEFGDGEEVVLDGIWGKTGDNWSFSAGLSFTSQSEVVMSDQDYSRCDTRPRLTDQDGGGLLDNIDPETGEQLCFGFIYGIGNGPFGFTRYEPTLGPGADPSNPNWDPEIQGIFGIPYFTTVPETPLDNSGEFYRDDLSWDIAQLNTETDLFSFSSLGSYDFSFGDLGATAYYEFYYNRRETRANGGHRQFFPLVPATNPTNPFGTNGPLAAFGGFTGQPVLPSYGLLDPNTDVEIDRYNLFIGLEGNLSATWTYDIYMGYGDSRGTYKGDTLLQAEVDASLDSVLVDGELVCADLVNNPGCVAADLFTEAALLRGELPADVLDYITKEIEGTTDYDSFQVAGYATGQLFELPAGAVMGVIGFEYRDESIDDKPDPESQAGNLWGLTAAGRTKGSDTVKEIFAEIELPLLADLPGIEELMFNGSGRYTDYDSFGDDETYRVALNWQVIPALRFRGTLGTSFRAPDLYEQFLADQTGFVSGLNDPCANYDDIFDPGDVVYDNCASQVPPDYSDAGLPGITTVTGGADTLLAETSDAWTYGFVWQPGELGFSFAMTWWDITIENTVQSLGATTVLGACYSSINFSSPLCQRIGPRDADGFITEIDASFVNVGEFNTSGTDIDFAYERSFNSFDLSLDTTVTYTDESNAELLGELENYEKKWGFPEWRGDLDVTVDWKNWQFNWRIDWIGKQSEDPVFDPGTTNVDRDSSIPHEFYHTLSARWTQGPWEVLGVIRNLSDEDPPIVPDGSGTLSATRVFNTLPGVGYPLFGRTYTLSIGREF